MIHAEISNHRHSPFKPFKLLVITMIISSSKYHNTRLFSQQQILLNAVLKISFDTFERKRGKNHSQWRAPFFLRLRFHKYTLFIHRVMHSLPLCFVSYRYLSVDSKFSGSDDTSERAISLFRLRRAKRASRGKTGSLHKTRRI